MQKQKASHPLVVMVGTVATIRWEMRGVGQNLGASLPPLSTILGRAWGEGCGGGEMSSTAQGLETVRRPGLQTARAVTVQWLPGGAYARGQDNFHLLSGKTHCGRRYYLAAGGVL